MDMGHGHGFVAARVAWGGGRRNELGQVGIYVRNARRRVNSNIQSVNTSSTPSTNPTCATYSQHQTARAPPRTGTGAALPGGQAGNKIPTSADYRYMLRYTCVVRRAF